MRLSPVWLAVFSDLFVNLSAGWIGAVIIVPNFSKEKGNRRRIILTVDILGAIFCLGTAFVLRRSL